MANIKQTEDYGVPWLVFATVAFAGFVLMHLPLPRIFKCWMCWRAWYHYNPEASRTDSWLEWKDHDMSNL